MRRQGIVRPGPLHPVHGDQHRRRLRSRGPDDLHRFAHRRPGRDHVVDDDDLALERRPDQRAAFAVVLGFLAVVRERHVAAALHVGVPGQRHGRGRGERDALVRGAEKHIELHARIQQRLGVEARQLADRAAAVEQSGIEEIGTDTARLDLEAAETQYALLQGESDEIKGGGGRVGGGHSNGSGRWQTWAFYPLSGRFQGAATESVKFLALPGLPAAALQEFRFAAHHVDQSQWHPVRLPQGPATVDGKARGGRAVPSGNQGLAR
ncbi:hypothetical protein D3C87_1421610 [compost metagenome]